IGIWQIEKPFPQDGPHGLPSAIILAGPRAKPPVFLQQRSIHRHPRLRAFKKPTMPVVGWIEVSRGGSGGWCGRRKHQAVSHRGSLFILGGYAVLGDDDSRGVNLNDVWCSEDGRTWRQLVARAPWSGRDGHAAVVHNGHVFLMGGTQDPLNNYNDVWRSLDGKEWERACQQAGWEGRWQHAAVSHGGSLYVLGGWAGDAGYLNDVWRSADGTRWTRCCAAAPWKKRMFHTVLSARGAMYLLGGSDGRNKLNDVWASVDGTEWTLVAHAAQWCPRAGHAAVTYDGDMYVFGGEDAARGRLDDIWVSSDGAHWEPSEAPRRFGGRQGHAVVEHAGTMFVLGGVSDEGEYLADCHRSLNERQAEALEEEEEEDMRAAAAAAAAAGEFYEEGDDADVAAAAAGEDADPATLTATAAAAALQQDYDATAAAAGLAIAAVNGDAAAEALNATARLGVEAASSPVARVGDPSRSSRSIWSPHRPPPTAGQRRTATNSPAGRVSRSEASSPWPYTGSESGIRSGGGRSGRGITVSMAAVVERLSQLEVQRTQLQARRRSNLGLLDVVEQALHCAVHVADDASTGAADVQLCPRPPAPLQVPPPELPITSTAAASDVTAPAATDVADVDALRMSSAAERSEIEALQRRLRRLVRSASGLGGGGGDGAGAVTELVEKRSSLAAAALPRALRLLGELKLVTGHHDYQEAAVSAAMVALEDAARLRRGRVWAEMSASRLQARPADEAGPAEGGENVTTDVTTNVAAADAAAAELEAWEAGRPFTAPAAAAGRGRQAMASSNARSPANSSGGLVANAPVLFASGEWPVVNDAAARFQVLSARLRQEEGGGAVPNAGAAAAALRNLRVRLMYQAGLCGALDQWAGGSTQRIGGAAGSGGSGGGDGDGGSGNSESDDNAVESDGTGVPANGLPGEDHGVDGGGCGGSGGSGDEKQKRKGTMAPTGPLPLVPGDVVDAMKLAREMDAGDAALARIRTEAHRAIDAELFEVPAACEQAGRLGDLLLLCGHDRLAHALTELRRDASELSLATADLMAWTERLRRLADGAAIAAECGTVAGQLGELREALLDAEDRVVDC
ncbi:unnamed protein product, partial [Phaeothamnion confervicola]